MDVATGEEQKGEPCALPVAGTAAQQLPESTARRPRTYSSGSDLGPPLDFLPPNLDAQELEAYRADYQAFRAGGAAGARGEVGDSRLIRVTAQNGARNDCQGFLLAGRQVGQTSVTWQVRPRGLRGATFTAGGYCLTDMIEPAMKRTLASHSSACTALVGASVTQAKARCGCTSAAVLQVLMSLIVRRHQPALTNLPNEKLTSHDRVCGKVSHRTSPRARKDQSNDGWWSSLVKLFTFSAVQDTARAETLQEYCFESLEEIGLLGCGSFGKVSLVRCQKTNQLLALKTVSKGLIAERGLENALAMEKIVMRRLYSPFTVRLAASFDRPEHVHLLMEAAMGGDILTAYWREAGLYGSEPHARFYTACIVRGLEHLHERRIIFRDLKMENLVLDARGYAKICDFGLSTEVGWMSYYVFTLCGTLEYLAPEIFSGCGYSYAIDWWALGVLLYEFMEGRGPFDGEDIMEIRERVEAGIDAAEFGDSTRAWADLVRSLCRKSPRERLPLLRGGIPGLEKHAWFEGFPWAAHARLELVPPYTPALDSPGDTQNFESEGQVPLEKVPSTCSYWPFPPKYFEDPMGPACMPPASAGRTDFNIVQGALAREPSANGPAKLPDCDQGPSYPSG